MPTYISINLNKPPKMTNSTSTKVRFGGDCAIVLAKQQGSHSIALAGKINEMLHPTN